MQPKFTKKIFETHSKRLQISFCFNKSASIFCIEAGIPAHQLPLAVKNDLSLYLWVSHKVVDDIYSNGCFSLEFFRNLVSQMSDHEKNSLLLEIADSWMDEGMRTLNSDSSQTDNVNTQKEKVLTNINPN